MRAWIILLFTCGTLFCEGYSARVLGLFPYPGKSHQIMFDSVMNKLAERGHQVTVATFFPLHNRSENYSEVSLQNLANIRVDFLDISFYEFPVWYMGIPIVGSIISQHYEHSSFGNNALELCDKLVKFQPFLDILKKEYDIVIVETFNSNCIHGLLDVFGIKAPVVGLSSCTLLPNRAREMGADDNPAYVPIITSSFSQRMSFFQRLENTIAYFILNDYFHTLNRKEQTIIEKNFGRKITDMHVLAANKSLILLNTYHVFNGVNPLVPGIVEVGGIHTTNTQLTNQQLPAFIEKYVNDSEHGIILCSFGSLLNSSSLSTRTENTLIKVFSKLKQRVIWKHSNAGEEGTNIGKNILRIRWLPQMQLLNHPKVTALIGHGGLLGSIEAVSAGKPMILIPILADQKMNAAVLKAKGVSEVLPITNINEENLKSALQNVLSESMREKARVISAMWHDRENSPLDTAIYWIEKVIRWGNQLPLYSEAKHLSFFQYALLDVIAFIALVMMLFFAIVTYVLKCLWKFFAKNILKNSTKQKLN